MKRVLEWSFAFLFFLIGLATPNQLYGQSDSTLLSYQEYLQNIVNYHPIAQKAALKTALAKAETLGAKGNLDPVLASDWSQKNFADKLYYQQFAAKLKFPTRLGIDVVGGYENTQGVFLNPENKTDDFGLWHLGLEVNILQGLIVNERKTALDQAKVFQDLAENEKQIILNDLVYNASSAYVIWQQYSYNQIVLAENLALANTYFENTRQSYANGEKSAMDTLEAFILYQDAIAFQQKNELGLIKSKQNVENHLWFKENPVTLQENTQPEDYTNQIFPSPKETENFSLANHPILLAAINKLSYAEIDQRLKREKLKPKLKLKYNPLLATADDGLNPNFAVNNYKWGFDFSMPLLLRSERANRDKGEIKIMEIKYDLQNKRNELQNKIEGSWLQQDLLREQIVLLDRNLENYRRLLDGENEKFRLGESSVFLLNKRQEKYIDGQLKLIETTIKQQIELLNFLYFSNQLMIPNASN